MRVAPLVATVVLVALSAPRAWAAAPPPAQVARRAQALIAELYPDDGPGVAVLVARGDQVLYRGARGLADVEHHVPLQPGDVFRIGSVTKQFSAAGLLRLVDAGRVSLDDPLSKYVPDYPGGDRIDIAQLLNHTAGVHDYTEIPGRMDEPVRRDLTTRALIDSFAGEPADFAPGTQWQYSNSGYVLVGAVIEAATGRSWHDYLETTLFEPLGLHDTGYGGDPARVAREVDGYTLDDGRIAPAAPISMTQPHAAGALVSTVDDLARWNRALHGGRVLSPAGYARMTTPEGAARDEGYGYGIGVDRIRGHVAYAHAGGIFGFSSDLVWVPDGGITVAVLHNSDSPSPAQSPNAVARRLAAIALGDPFPGTTPVHLDAQALRAYEGVYRVDAVKKRALRVVDGRLTSQRVGGGTVVPLTPTGPATFVYPDGLNRFEVVRGADGRVDGLRFYPGGEGDGVLMPRLDEALPAPM